MYGLLWFMNENEVISNIGALLPNHMVLSRVYFNVSRQILHHRKFIGKRILDVFIIGLELGNLDSFLWSDWIAQFLGNFQ